MLLGEQHLLFLVVIHGGWRAEERRETGRAAITDVGMAEGISKSITGHHISDRVRPTSGDQDNETRRESERPSWIPPLKQDCEPQRAIPPRSARMHAWLRADGVAAGQSVSPPC